MEAKGLVVAAMAGEGGVLMALGWQRKAELGLGAWGAQSVEHLTLDFSSGHDPRVVRYSAESGSVLSGEPA